MPTFLEENNINNDKNNLSLNTSSFLPLKDYNNNYSTRSGSQGHGLLDPSNLSFPQNTSINYRNYPKLSFLSDGLVQKPSNFLDYSIQKPGVNDMLLNYNHPLGGGSSMTHPIFDLNDRVGSDQQPFYPSLNKSSILQTLNNPNGGLGEDTFANPMNQDESFLFNTNSKTIGDHQDLLNLCDPTSLNACPSNNELLFNNSLVTNSPPGDPFLFSKGSINNNSSIGDFLVKPPKKQKSNESQSSSNKSSDDDLSTLLKINKYLEEKGAWLKGNSFKKEWLKNKLKNCKSLKRYFY